MSLTYKSYNPDVLNCLANLSSDEVFTPPKVANDMLDMLPADLWSNPNTTFLDPVSKSGVFLREITKRLLKGLEHEFPDLQERLNHILTKQVFGIAITELTSLMSRRTLYCSKHANEAYSICTDFEDKKGNIKYKNREHTWDNKGKCTYCGASAELYERGEELEYHAYQFIHTEHPEKIYNNMKFDVIIGNPPYQLDDGGAQASAMPIYHLFVEQAIKMNPRYLSMIIPSRWFSGGKGLKSFRDEMISDKRIAEIHDFEDAKECFPGVEIKGGVCYFLWNSMKDNKKCKINTYKDGKIVSADLRPLKEDFLDIFIRYNEALSIVRRVYNANQTKFSSIVQSRNPFGLATNFSNIKNQKSNNSIKVYANKRHGYVDCRYILRNSDWIDKWKVIIPYAVGNGDLKTDELKPLVIGPRTCCTETYLVIGPLDTEQEARNVVSYMRTRFFHFLLGLKKITQHATSDKYELIPLLDFSKIWSDAVLYKQYNLSKLEIEFIESMILPGKDLSICYE